MTDARCFSRLDAINQDASDNGKVTFVGDIPFGPTMRVRRFELGNGLRILLCPDNSAPVIAYHTWFRVGSRHERPGKTGLAHLFEHLMFNETETHEAGLFDRLLEEAGAESNASTWLDWTQYNCAIPKENIALVVELEAERMAHLVLRDPQVTSEKEVVANERRYRVDDDVEGAVNELLWKTAYTKHAYHWPTIGWMEDIEGFTTEDCREFYQAFYCPNNATVVVTGDYDEGDMLQKISSAYGSMGRGPIPLEDVQPEPPQTAERRVTTHQPTTSEKLSVGYHSPGLGDFDHLSALLMGEILAGGRASRLHRRLVRDLELSTGVQAFVGPFRDPSLTEFYASACGDHTAEEMLTAMDEELTRIAAEPVTEEELSRAKARIELSLLSGLETADGKASTLGFYETVLGQPDAPFQRLDTIQRLDASDVRRIARSMLRNENRTVVLVKRSETPASGDAGTEAA